MNKQIYTCLLLTVLVSCLHANNMKYVNDKYLIQKSLMNEKLQMALTTMAIDGQYFITSAYLSSLNGNASVDTESNSIEFILIPAARINYVDNGIGQIQERYTGADGIAYNAPVEDWNKFAFFAQRDTVQLYFLQIEALNSTTNQIEKKYLTSVESGKMSFKSAIAGNSMEALSQMFAIQGDLNVNVFQPPYYGLFVFSPVVYFSGNSGSINTIVGSDDLKAGPVINLTTYSNNDSLFVLSNNRNSCEFALIEVDDVVRVTEVVLDEELITFISDNPDMQWQSLTATVLPENASNKSIQWISTNEAIAVVSENGEVSAKSTGRTYVKAISNDGMLSDSCLVIVKTSSGLIIQENTAITNHSGSMDFSFEAYTSDIFSAAFSIQLPAGYSLTENGIVLADELTSLLSIGIAPVSENEWKVDLQPVQTATDKRSAAFYKKLLDVNYTVNTDLENGFYDIIVKDIDIKSDNDMHIQEAQLIVPSNILRNTTGNQLINKTFVIYNNGELIINNNCVEMIDLVNRRFLYVLSSVGG